MGCGSSNFNSQNNIINDSYDEYDEQISKNVQGKLFLEIVEIARKEKIVELKNLKLEQQTYFDLLNYLSNNYDLEVFKMINISINSEANKLVYLANILSKKINLKSITLINLMHLGNKRAKSIAKIMQDCISIEELVIKNIEIEINETKYIKKIISDFSPNLKTLQISSEYLKDNLNNFITSFKDNKTLQNLILSKMQINEIIFSNLINAIVLNNNLICLDVSHNSIGLGVKIFRQIKITNIQTLKMNNCNINDECFEILTEGLETNISILELELNSNEITLNSQKNFPLFFNKNKTLKKIYLLKNKISIRDIKEVINNEDLHKIISEF